MGVKPKQPRPNARLEQKEMAGQPKYILNPEWNASEEDMDAQGWEFVGYGEKKWHNAPSQSWWIFRRPIL